MHTTSLTKVARASLRVGLVALDLVSRSWGEEFEVGRTVEHVVCGAQFLAEGAVAACGVDLAGGGVDFDGGGVFDVAACWSESSSFFHCVLDVDPPAVASAGDDFLRF